ncbi:MAG: hemerythrin domain-containing protein [Myxococcota bacterium]
MTSLAAWRSRHDTLEAALRAAARVAPERDAARFAVAWGGFRAAMTLHLAQEERWLLPAFDAYGRHAAPNQRPAVVRADHERIRAHLAAVEAAAPDLPGLVARAATLALLLAVLEHHDRREAAGMLTVLDAHVPAAERGAWLARIAEEEAALVLPTVVLAPAPPPWPWAGDDPADRLAAEAAQDGDVAAALRALPTLAGPAGQRVHQGLVAAVARADAADLGIRRDALLSVADGLRRWRAVRAAR